MKLSYKKLKMPLISPFTTSFGTDTDKDVYIFILEDNVKCYGYYSLNKT